MPYGEIRVDTITFTNGGVDTSISVSGLAASTTGNLTVTGTISGTTVRATTISGVTVTGTTVQGASGTFTSITGGTATITSGLFASGTAANPSIAIIGDANTGLYSPGADQVAISTSGTGRLFVTASGNVGLGTSTPTAGYIFDAAGNIYASNGFISSKNGGNQVYMGAAGQMNFGSTGSDLIIGTTAAPIRFGSTSTNIEWARFDVSGRFLVGTSSSVGVATPLGGQFQVVDTSVGIGSITTFADSANGGFLMLGKSRGATVGSYTVVQNNDQLGTIRFGGSDGTDLENFGASIEALVDGTPGTNDMPGRLVFSTTADGAASPSPRMTIKSDGNVGIGSTSPQALCHLRSDADGAVTHLYLQNRNAGANAQSRIAFTDSANDLADSRHAYIGTVSTGAGQNGNSFVIATNPNGGSAQERVWVSSTGNVGIGTTAPGELFEVAGNIRVSANTGSFRLIGAADSSDTTVVLQGGGTSGSGGNIELDRNGDVVYDGTNHRFRNVSGSSEYARIDSSGRLLVGASTAPDTNYGTTTGLLVVNNTPLPVVFTAYTNDIYGGRLDFVKSRSTTFNGKTIVQNGDALGVIIWGGADGTNIIPAGRIGVEVDGTPGTNDMPGRLVFSTTADGASSPTERMRITSDGFINCFTAAGGLQSRQVEPAGTTNATFVGRYSATDTLTGTISFAVYTNGNVVNTNNSYGAISDIKLKENIVAANSQWDDLKALQVRNYNFKEGQTHTQIGLIAQEAELVSPGLVYESPDRDEEGNDLGTVSKSVNYSVLYMKAVKALQEAMERIEILEAKVAVLEGV